MNKIDELFESKCEKFFELKRNFDFIKGDTLKECFYQALKEEFFIDDEGIELFEMVGTGFASDNDKIKNTIKEKGVFKIKDCLQKSFISRFCNDFDNSISFLCNKENYSSYEDNYTKIEKNDDLQIICISKFIGVKASELDKFEFENDIFIDTYFQKVIKYYINSNVASTISDIKDKIGLNTLFYFSKTQSKQYLGEKVFYFTLNVEFKYSELINVGEFDGEKYLISKLKDMFKFIDKIIYKSESIFDDYSYTLF